MLPGPNTYDTIMWLFISLAMSPAFDPHALKEATVFENCPAEAMRLPIFKLTLFDASVVPASAADSIFLVGFFVDLTIVIVSTNPVVLNVETLSDKMVVSNLGHGDDRQLFPLEDGRDRDLLRYLAKDEVDIVEKTLLVKHTYKGFIFVGLKDIFW